MNGRMAPELACFVEAVGCEGQLRPPDDPLRMTGQARKSVVVVCPLSHGRLQFGPARSRIGPGPTEHIRCDTLRSPCIHGLESEPARITIHPREDTGITGPPELPVAVATRPVAQGVHALAPAAEMVPLAHESHEVAPTVLE